MGGQQIRTESTLHKYSRQYLRLVRFVSIWRQQRTLHRNDCIFFAQIVVEKNLGKGENAGHQHFLISQKCFQKPISIRPHGNVKCRVNTAVRCCYVSHGIVLSFVLFKTWPFT